MKHKYKYIMDIAQAVAILITKRYEIYRFSVLQMI